MSLQDTFSFAGPLGADGGALLHVLVRAGMSRTRSLRVTGFAGPTALQWLLKYGYDQAVYTPVEQLFGLCATDALLTANGCAAGELHDALADGGCLKAGGVLIVQAMAGEAIGHYRAVLIHHGFCAIDEMTEKGRWMLLAKSAPGQA